MHINYVYVHFCANGVAAIVLGGVYFIFHILYFIFEFFKEGSPSAEAVFQGALR